MFQSILTYFFFSTVEPLTVFSDQPITKGSGGKIDLKIENKTQSRWLKLNPDWPKSEKKNGYRVLP